MCVCVCVSVSVCLSVYVCVCVNPTLSLQVGCDSVLSSLRSNCVWFLSVSFSLSGCVNKAKKKKSILSDYLHIAGLGTDGFMPFPRAFVWNETQKRFEIGSMRSSVCIYVCMCVFLVYFVKSYRQGFSVYLLFLFCFSCWETKCRNCLKLSTGSIVKIVLIRCFDQESKQAIKSIFPIKKLNTQPTIRMPKEN